MATSGNYRRFYIDDKGNKVAHTIDPRTGLSAVTDLLSATVIAPTCAEADAYGTMFMAMGAERAVKVAKTLQQRGIMVYFIASKEGGGYKVYYSSSLASMLKTVDGFIAIE
jgi:thiamine biosynthesis lipoprotein